MDHMPDPNPTVEIGKVSKTLIRGFVKNNVKFKIQIATGSLPGSYEWVATER